MSFRLALLFLVASACLANCCVRAEASWEHPFASNSIWNTHLNPKAVYVPCKLGVLGAIANDREWLFVTKSTDPYRPVYQPQGFEKPGVYIPNSLTVPNEPNGAAAFLMPDGITVREYNAFSRVAPTTNPNPIGYWEGDGRLDGDSLNNTGHSGSGLSALGGSIRLGEINGTGPIEHALKIELDWGVLYRNPNSSLDMEETFRWPADRSDGNYPGGGNVPNYTGTNSALRMGSLVAIPQDVNIGSLGLTPQGHKIAEALQNYGAYVVDTTGNHWRWANGGYTLSICVESEATLDASYFSPDNNYRNNDKLFSDFSLIYPLLAVINSNGPNSIGG